MNQMLISVHFNFLRHSKSIPLLNEDQHQDSNKLTFQQWEYQHLDTSPSKEQKHHDPILFCYLKYILLLLLKSNVIFEWQAQDFQLLCINIYKSLLGIHHNRITKDGFIHLLQQIHRQFPNERLYKV